MQRFGGKIGNIPPVVLNLLIINVILFLATTLFRSQGINLERWLALYYTCSSGVLLMMLLLH